MVYMLCTQLSSIEGISYISKQTHEKTFMRDSVHCAYNGMELNITDYNQSHTNDLWALLHWKIVKTNSTAFIKYKQQNLYVIAQVMYDLLDILETDSFVRQACTRKHPIPNQQKFRVELQSMWKRTNQRGVAY